MTSKLRFMTAGLLLTGGLFAIADEKNAHKYTNELIHETSPYLLQHAHNPVNWHAWGPEVLAKAKRENKPIFVSVGYSTCYWCHVMERESFENEAVAKVLNEHFIAVKVDREERPDVDQQLMLATQLMTGRGGWPNSLWLTPEGKPWMAGTYFPPEQFTKLLVRLNQLWTNDRQRVQQQAEQLSAAIRAAEGGGGQAAAREVNRELVDRALNSLKNSYDETYAGWGERQKFPPHDALRLIVDQYRRESDPALLAMLTETLDAMAAGGIRDHVGGGFHRYATDRRWFLPHFEKMLYDNAQLMRLYADGYLLTGDERYRQVASELFAWLEREMHAAEGGFFSALDSESDGEEGRYYVWRYDEVLKLLGQDEGRKFAEAYGMKPSGNWVEEATGRQADTNILYLPAPLDQAMRKQMQSAREKLLAARNQRVRPHLDDKIITSWNGLMISSLAYAGHTLEEPRYTQAAKQAADFVLTKMTDKDGHLLRTYRNGVAKLPGYLTDYAFLADGLLELYAATGDERWLAESKQLADIMLSEFEDQQDHAFYFTSAQHDDLLLRSKNLLGGGNIPSGNGVAIQVMLRLGQITGDDRYTTAGRRATEALAERMWQSPRGAESLIVAAAEYLAPRDPGQAPAAEDEAPPDAHFAKHPLAVDVYASQLKVAPGGDLQLAVRLTIAEGWHVYGENPEMPSLIATGVGLVETDAVRQAEVIRPEAEQVDDPVFKTKLNVLSGQVWFQVPVTLATDVPTGSLTLQIKLTSQACDESRCLAPQTETVEIPIEVSSDADEERRHEAVFRALE